MKEAQYVVRTIYQNMNTMQQLMNHIVLLMLINLINLLQKTSMKQSKIYYNELQ